MLSIIKPFNFKRFIIYTIVLSMAGVYLHWQTGKHADDTKYEVQIPIYDLSNPDQFIHSFITTKSESKNYTNLLKTEQLFEKTFPDANVKQKALFKIYYLASLSSKHPNLYEKLHLLENSLSAVNTLIKDNPRSYELRIARINLHTSLPVYFRDFKLIKMDLDFLIDGFKNAQEFEFSNASRKLSADDFICIHGSLKQHNLLGLLDEFTINDDPSPLT